MTTNKEKKIKALFIFPPTWSTFSISTGIPQIMGYLIQNGYEDVEALDLNIKFHRYYYKKSRLKKLLEDIRKEKNRLFKDIYFDKTGKIETYNVKKSIFYTYDSYLRKIKDDKILKQAINDFSELIHTKDKSLNTLSKYANKTMKINDLICISIPNSITFSPNHYITYFNNNFDKPLINYYGKIIEKILKNEYDYIGFSVNHSAQVNTAFLLSKMLKEKGYNGHISWGGTSINEEINIIKSSRRFFEEIVDSVMLGAGEVPTKELFEYIKGKRRIEDISNIMYKTEDNIIVQNQIKNQYITEFITPSYRGYDIKDYTLPENVLPIRTSTGCYWGKCTFCDYNVLTKYKSRTADDVINEIKTLIKKHKVNNFYFVDAALSPKFLDEFSRKIIEQKLEIYYFTNLRFEAIYTKEFLQRLYDSGLRCAGWGFESASPRILKLMNKGTNIETTQKILIDSHNIGISNHLYLIIAFPTETQEEFNTTIDFIYKNKERISSIAEHYFHLKKNSYIYSNKSEFKLNENRIKEIEIRKQGINSFSSIDLGLKIDFEYYDKQIEILRKEIKENYKYSESSFETLLLASKYMSLKKEKKNFWSKLFK